MADTGQDAIIRAGVDATGVETGLTSIKRSISDLGAAARAIGADMATASAGISTGVDAASKATAKATRAVIKETAEATIALQSVGKALTDIDKQEVRLNFKGVDPAIIDGLMSKKRELAKLDEAAAVIARKATADAVASAAQQSAALAVLIADEAHYGDLKKQHAAFQVTQARDIAVAQQVQANQAIAAIKAEQAAFAAFSTEIQNAELNLTHFGRAKTAAFLTDKGARLGFDPAMVQTQLAGLAKIETANAAVLAAANPHMAEFTKRAADAGTSVKGLNAAMRGVPAQFTDIIVSLQGGQAPFTVLMQQGGQLKDMFGGIGPAFRALGSYVLSIINPLTVAGAGIAALTYAYFKGAHEATEYSKAIILSGNASGTTAAQMQGYALAISKVSGTQGSAAEAIAQFVTSGKVGAENLQDFTLAAIKFEKATGTAIKDTVQQFAELAKSPLESSIKLNEQYGYLTTSVYKQIKALEDQGKATEAADLAQKTFADTLSYRSSAILGNIGLIEQGWNAVKKAISGAADAAANIGRAITPVDRLKAIANELEKLQTPTTKGGSAFDTNGVANDPRRAARIASLQAEAAVIQGIAFSQAESAKAQAAQLDTTKANVEFDKIAVKFISEKAKIQKEITEATNVALRAGKSQAEIDKLVADIRLSHNKTGAAGTGQTEVADIMSRVKAQKDYLIQLRENGAEAVKQTEGDKLVLKIKEELKTSITGVARAQKVKALASAEELAATDAIVKKEERRINGLKRSEEAYAAMLDKVRQEVNATGEKADQMEAANSMWGKGTVAIEKYKLSLDNLRLSVAEGGSDSSYSEAYLVELRLKAANQQRVITQAQIADYKTLNEKATEYARTVQAEAVAYGDEAGLAAMSTLERAKALAIRKVDLEVAKQIAEVERSGATDAAKEAVKGSINATALRDKQTQVSKAVADDFVKIADSINSTLTDALLRGFESGKGFARNLRDTIVNMFKTMILRPIISAVMNPIAGAITGSLGLAGAAQAAGTGSNLLSGVGTASSVYSLVGAATTAIGQFGTAALVSTQSLLGMGGTMAQMTQAAQVVAAGGTTTSMAIGAMAPYALAALAVLAVHKLTQGETRNGAAYGVGLDGKASLLQGPSGGEIASKEARAMFDVTKASIEGLLTGFGSKAVLTGFTAGLESSVNGKGFAFSTGKIGGAAFGDTNTVMNSRGNKTQEQALKDFQLELSQSILEALQVTADIPATVAKLISAGLNGSEVKALTVEATNAILASVSKMSIEVNAFKGALLLMPFASLKTLSFDAAAGLIAAAGGLEKLTANVDGYYQNFYTAAEQTAQLTANTAKAFTALGLTMPVLDDGARAAYRALVDLAAGQDLSIEANAKAYTSLLALQDPMNKLAPAFAAVAESTVAFAANMLKVTEGLQSAGASLQDQLDKLVMSEADYRAKQIAGMTALQVAQFDTNAALQKSIDAFGVTAAAVATRTDADIRLLTAQGKTQGAMTLQRSKDVLGMNAAQTAAYDYSKAIDATIESLNAARALAATKSGLIDKYDPMTAVGAGQQVAAVLGKSVVDALSAGPAGEIRTAIANYARTLDPLTASGQKAIEQLNLLTPALDLFVTNAVESAAATVAAAAAETEKSKALVKSQLGFDAQGLASMLTGAISKANPAAAAADFAAALETSVRGALLGSVINTISESIYKAIITPILLGAAVSEATTAGVIESAKSQVTALTAVMSSDAFKGLLTTINNAVQPLTLSADKLAPAANGAADAVKNLSSAAGGLGAAAFDFRQKLDSVVQSMQAALAFANNTYVPVVYTNGFTIDPNQGSANALTAISSSVTQFLGHIKTAAQTTAQIVKASDSAIGNSLLKQDLTTYFAGVGDAFSKFGTLVKAVATNAVATLGGLSVSALDAVHLKNALGSVPGINTANAATLLAIGGAATKVSEAISKSLLDAIPEAIKNDPKLAGVSAEILSVIGSVKQGDLQGMGDSFNLLSGSLASGKLTTEQYAVAIGYVTDAFKTSATAVNDILSGLANTRRQLEIDLLNAQGRTTEASAAKRLIDIAGYDAASIAAYDYNTLLTKSIATQTERNGLQDQLNTLTDTAAQALTRQRNALSESNRALFDQIQTLKAEADAKAATEKAATDAMSGLQRAVDAQRKIVQVARDAAAASVSEITSVFDILKSSVKELYGTVDSTAQMQADQGRAFIKQALATAQSTGYLPESKALTDAVNAAKGNTAEFASQFEKDFAALTLAGDLSLMEILAKGQLTAAEKALKVQDDQLKALDGVLTLAQQQLDAANGINTSVLSVAQAVAKLDASISALAANQAAATQAALAAAVKVPIVPGVTAPIVPGVTAPIVPGVTAPIVPGVTAPIVPGVTAPIVPGVTAPVVPGVTASIPQNFKDAFARVGSAMDPSLVNAMIESGANAAAVREAAHNAGVRGFATGINRVPFDMTAQIHEGEAIVPAAMNPFNPNARQNGLGSNTDRLESLVEGLTQEVQRLQAIVNDGNKNTRRAADAVNGNPEMPMLVQAV